MQTATRRQADQTRQKLLDAAFQEIHRMGFRGASLDTILSETGVTKGALYHHFGSKAELGYAVVDEIVRPFVFENWQAVMDAPNVVDAAIGLLHERIRERSVMALTLGCPFNNLMQEMSPVDAGFHQRLAGILEDWRCSMVRAIRQGQARGHVREDIDVEATAAFIISAVEGCIGMAKGAQSREFYERGMGGLEQYLNNLRANAAAPEASGRD